MKKPQFLAVAFGFSILSATVCGLVGPAAYAADFVAPTIFQAAGPTAPSIQSTVDAFRAALGDPNNGNAAGPLTTGRREINWDGGGNTDTTPPATPFIGFLNIRGAQFTTPGTGLSQAPPSGGAQGGLVTLFNNPTYANIFGTFSAPRLFTPFGSNQTDAWFSIPGTNGGTPAVVKGFGAVFTDVDLPEGHLRSRLSSLKASTLMDYYDVAGQRIFSAFVPAAPGNASFSFLGIVFNDARIARVRIITGNKDPGPEDGNGIDIVMMDDFIYGEPQAIQ
jgi:hypothetical protein